MKDEKIQLELTPEQLGDVIDALTRAAEQDAEDIEILASLPMQDWETINVMSESRARLLRMSAWLHHILEEAE